MSLADGITADYQQALRARDELRVRVLRFLRAAIKDAAIDAGHPLDDPAVLEVIRRQAKQRRDSIEAYRAGGRADLVAQEEAELAVIEAYLPAELSDEQLRELARVAIAETGVSTPAGLGQVMKVLMPRVRGQADGRRVNAIVRELLSG